jgi:polyhydroxybutyrate depolymerase
MAGGCYHDPVRPALPVLLALVALAGCGREGRLLRGFERRTLDHAGLTREYLVHVPARAAGAPAPLVLALHGGGGSARDALRLTDGALRRLSDREGFVLVAPEGIDHAWNDGRPTGHRRAHRENVDDVGFLAALVGALVRDAGVDARRVYATGISNGGMMAYRLACERSDAVTAIAPVAAAMPEWLGARCAPRRPVPVLAISGTDDPLVPWGGGEVHFGRRAFGRVLSQAETIRGWVARNGCTATPVTTQLPDRDPRDGTRARRDDYCAGTAGAVGLVTVEGGGHTWPGGRHHLPRAAVGVTSRDFDASEAIWGFFRGHSRP